MSPALTDALNFHFFFSSIPGVSTPLRIYSPISSARTGKERCMPSYIPSKRPGPKVTDNGFPVFSIGSPGFIPDVSS